MRNTVSRLRAIRLAWTAAAIGCLAAACSTDGALTLRPDVDVGAQTAAVTRPASPLPAPSQPMPAPVVLEPDEVAQDVWTQSPMSSPLPAPALSTPPSTTLVGYPRLDSPVEPQFSAPKPRAVMPASEVACRKELRRMGVQFTDLPAIRDSAACSIDWPVRVTAVGKVGMKPSATLTCAMAATYAEWTNKELVPTARWKFWSGVKTIHQGSSYSCRNIRGTRTASEHSTGNALDIMRIELNNGRDIDVRKQGFFAFNQRGFLNSVRADGCSYFSTVLGPGYNPDHADHFHFDIKPRRNGRVACH
jgi:hypothetical protein